MSVKLAYNTNSWGPNPDLRTMLEQIKQAGWDGWEVRQPLDWLGSAERVLALTEEVGLPAAGVSWHPLKVGNQATIEYNRRRIDLAKALGASNYVFASPERQRNKAVSKEDAAWLAMAARELSDHGAEVGVDVSFHPHTGTICLGYQEWGPVMEAAPNLKLCFDVVHLLLGGDDIESTLRSYRDRIAYAHLHDFRTWTFVNLGQGNLYDIGEALAGLEKAGFQGWVAANGGHFDGTTPPQSARICRDHLRSVGY